MTHVTNVTHIKQQTDDPPDVIIIVIIIIIFIKSCQNAADIHKINNSSYTTCVLTILLVNTIPHFCANIWPNHAVMITGRDSWPNCWGRRDGGLKAQYYPPLITLVTKKQVHHKHNADGSTGHKPWPTRRIRTGDLFNKMSVL